MRSFEQNCERKRKAKVGLDNDGLAKRVSSLGLLLLSAQAHSTAANELDSAREIHPDAGNEVRIKRNRSEIRRLRDSQPCAGGGSGAGERGRERIVGEHARASAAIVMSQQTKRQNYELDSWNMWKRSTSINCAASRKTKSEKAREPRRKRTDQV